jgi:hypothetical protein
MNISEEKYSVAFTAGGLLEKEAFSLVSEYLKTKDWSQTYEIIKQENSFQYRTLQATNRVFHELKSRLIYLDDNALELIVSGFSNESKQLLWFAVCRRYLFIFDFAREILREKYFIGQDTLTAYDFDAFINRKAVQYPSLEKITDSTRYKLKQVLFKMLREVGLLSRNNQLQVVLPTDRVIEIIKAQSPAYLSIFIN